MAEFKPPPELTGVVASFVGAVAKLCHTLVKDPERRLGVQDFAAFVLGMIAGYVCWLIAHELAPQLETATGIVGASLGARLFNILERAAPTLFQALLKKVGVQVDIAPTTPGPLDRKGDE